MNRSYITRGTQRINLIHKHDSWLLLTCHCEHCLDKTMHYAFDILVLTYRALSPCHFDTRSEEETDMNVLSAWEATALAM